MRKMIASGVGEEISRVDLLVRPFLALKNIQLVAQKRDPLAALAEKLVEQGNDAALVNRAIVLFREGRTLDAV